MSQNLACPFSEATGTIRYNMTNDYMFRYILQKYKPVLKGLICSLLRLATSDVKSLTIKNPINLAEDITGKEFILDINVLLNDDTTINLEMQVVNEHNWPDRSLSYLCRSFDQLYRGNKYDEALPVIHIGFLDFTLFPECPEFYATNMLMNVKNHHIFNSKFVLSVVDLSQIELATEKDEKSGIAHWARLFKAKTWEEIKMLAENNKTLQEAANCIYEANADEIVRQRCFYREEAERHERTIKRDMEELNGKIDFLEGQVDALEGENISLKGENTSLKEEKAALLEKLKSLEGKIKGSRE